LLININVRDCDDVVFQQMGHVSQGCRSDFFSIFENHLETKYIIYIDYLNGLIMCETFISNRDCHMLLR